MTNILLLSYYFPPQTSVGTFRIQRFVEHGSLTEENCNINATILTTYHPDKQFHPYTGTMKEFEIYQGVNVHRVKDLPVKQFWQYPTRILKYLYSGMRIPFQESEIAARFWHIDMEWGWMIPAYRKALQLIETHQPEAIMVSCPPFSSATIGAWLKRKTGLPLILDFRDGWVASSKYLNKVAMKDGAREHRILQAADALIVTSDSDAATYGELIGNERVHLIYNGYDRPFILPDNTAPPTTDGPLELLYLGAWGVFGRSPELLLKALQQAKIPWKLTSIGHTNHIVSEIANSIGVSEHVTLVDALPKTELIPWITQCDALFVVKGTPDEGGRDTHIAAKIYDYLATGKPILAQLPEGDSKDMMMRYATHAYFSTADDITSLVKTVQTLYADKQQGTISSMPNQEFLDSFSGVALTAKLSSVLSDVVTRHNQEQSFKSSM